MINFLMAVSIIFTPSPPERETGILSQYSIGVMPGVVEARQEWGHIPADLSGIDGFIAVVDCDRMGDVGLLSVEGHEWVTIMVADCSGHVSTTEWMNENNIIAEISGELAERFDVVCLCPLAGEIVWLPSLSPD